MFLFCPLGFDDIVGRKLHYTVVGEADGSEIHLPRLNLSGLVVGMEDEAQLSVFVAEHGTVADA